MKIHLGKLFFALLLVACSSPAFANSAVNNNCGAGYDQNDRGLVFDTFNLAMADISQMQALALDSSEGVYSVAQREALEMEYMAYREHIDQLGKTPIPGISDRSQSFLTLVLNARFLRLIGTSVTGPTISSAQRNARKALLATSKSDLLLWGCFVSSN